MSEFFFKAIVTKLGVEETTEIKNLIVVKFSKFFGFYEQVAIMRHLVDQFNRGRVIKNCWYFYI